MTRLSRRLFLQTAGGVAWTSMAFGSYAFALEPGFLLKVTPYHINPPGWPKGLQLRAVLIADVHACEPWMPASRVRSIAEIANALQPDILFLLGDYSAGHSIMTEPVAPEAWGEALSILKAPLGVYSVLGNHDWLHGPLPSMPSDDAVGVRKALRNAGVTVLENDAVRIENHGRPFWVAGLGDQLAGSGGRGVLGGCDDLPATLAQVSDSAPIVMLAHEPAIFRRMPDRVAVTLSGHTHGGQVNLPNVQTRFARVFNDLVYGHIVEQNRHLIISGGLGTSHAPIRFMRPPELVEATIGGAPPQPLSS